MCLERNAESMTVHLYINHTANSAFKFHIHPATGNSCWAEVGGSLPEFKRSTGQVQVMSQVQAKIQLLHFSCIFPSFYVFWLLFSFI